MRKEYLAIDLGASSGRGMIGSFDGKTVRMDEIYRFENAVNRVLDTQYWEILRIFRQVKHMIGTARKRGASLEGVGIDTWALDYGLLDQNGKLLGPVISYWNAKQADVNATWKKVPQKELFETTGTGHLMLNTVYQLYGRKRRHDSALEEARTLLMIPDLLAYFLTGEKMTEYTNSLTTMLVDHKTGAWSRTILDKLGLPIQLFTEIQLPGYRYGSLFSGVQKETGAGDIPVYAVATHDTASAIAAIPVKTTDFVYISSGTWSLIGVESDTPIVSEKAFRAGFSNEGSLQGTYRFNKNIMGMALIQAFRKKWNALGNPLSWNDIVQLAERDKGFSCYIDPDASQFFDTSRILESFPSYCQQTGQKEPASFGAIARCIYESMAMKYRYSLEQIEKITGKRYETIHIVGGGCQNALLNQFTANACGRPVVAGPVEGSSMGNVLAQAIGAGEVSGIRELREIVSNSITCTVYEPKDTEFWEEEYGRFLQIVKLDKETAV